MLTHSFFGPHFKVKTNELFCPKNESKLIREFYGVKFDASSSQNGSFICHKKKILRSISINNNNNNKICLLLFKYQEFRI